MSRRLLGFQARIPPRENRRHRKKEVNTKEISHVLLSYIRLLSGAGCPSHGKDREKGHVSDSGGVGAKGTGAAFKIEALERSDPVPGQRRDHRSL